MGLHFEMFKNRNQVICKARERNPLRWSSKIRQYKISKFEVLNSIDFEKLAKKENKDNLYYELFGSPVVQNLLFA